MAIAAAEPGARAAPGMRRVVLVAIALAGVWAAWVLALDPRQAIPGGDELRVLGRFLGHALSPALSYESEFVPDSAPPIAMKALDGARRTVVFAAAAMSIAMVLGLVLGFLGSTAWWVDDPVGGTTPLVRTLRAAVAPAVYLATRVTITSMRSVHELLWAVLFLCAIGLNSLSAVIAIAIPYAGTLAKVFSEMIDEAPRDAAEALRGAGATPGQVFVFGLVSRALPDMSAYAFYRFECALRSSAIVGFFGPETLGKFIKQSWNENHYGEVWTYLYTLFVLIVLLDWWSGAMRRRFVA